MITKIMNGYEVVGLKVDLDPITDISMYPNLKFIATPCTGTDHIKVIGVDIIHLDDEWKKSEGQDVTSTAEHTWSLILQLAKKDRMQLRGKNLAIIGYGRIGNRVYEYAKAFGMHVDTYDDDLEWRKFLGKYDIITIHVPLNDETRGMISDREISFMKKGVLIVNTSRSDIVQHHDILDNLICGQLGGYADDFLEDVPIQHHMVIQTPHIGGNCKDAREATDLYINKKIDEYIGSKLNILNGWVII